MHNDTVGAQFVRGLVKTVFIGCYAAFMWASIHHVAAFFDNFEQNGASDTLGSYLLAGAIDITALVTTIGVMFFRKSMPRSIQGIVWVFIIGLAIYSFFINWEYASHYQNDALVLQPTGQTTPLYDAQGRLHYVPVMAAQTWLLVVNPALASSFTIFALIYSVVGEFFGAKAPTAQELQARKQYLQETAPVLEDIRKLEAKGKKPGLIQRGKQAALELKEAMKEVAKQDGIDQPSIQQTREQVERTTGPFPQTSTEESARKGQAIREEPAENASRHRDLTPEERVLASTYEKTLSWLTDGRSTVSLKVVAETMNQSMKLLHNRVASRTLQATKNKEIVRKDSVIAWAISEVIPKESQKKAPLKLVRNEPETVEPLGMIERAMLDAIQNATEQERAELRTLAETKPLDELTRMLRERYPHYASYITEKRVARVMACERKTVDAQAV